MHIGSTPRLTIPEKLLQLVPHLLLLDPLTLRRSRVVTRRFRTTLDLYHKPLKRFHPFAQILNVLPSIFLPISLDSDFQREEKLKGLPFLVTQLLQVTTRLRQMPKIGS